MTITAEMIVVKHIFSVLKMSNWTRVYLNNLLSILFQPFFFILSSEQTKIRGLDFSPIALIFLALSCILGTCLAWSGTALRARLSATTFTVVGVACKVATELVNLLIWDKHANQNGLLALLACFIGSLMFVPAPHRSEETWFSNAVWNCLNRISFGGLKRAELETPAFSASHGDVHGNSQKSKFVPVPLQEEEHIISGNGADVETNDVKNPTALPN